MKSQRHFLRCPDCLGVWAVDIEPSTSIEPARDAGCPYQCGATCPPEHMGRVQGDRLRRAEGTRAACDSSCTYARGPKCECKCGGKNHGAGVLAEIPVHSDQGSARARFRAAPKTWRQARKRRVEWSKALDQITEALSPLLERRAGLLEKRQRDGWLGDHDFHTLSELGELRRRASDLGSMRTHSGRMKAAQKLVETAQGWGRQEPKSGA